MLKMQHVKDEAPWKNPVGKPHCHYEAAVGRRWLMAGPTAAILQERAAG